MPERSRVTRVTAPQLIDDAVEEHRDRHWFRGVGRRVESPLDAERFIEHVGFASCLADSRRPGPSLYVAVCGRRDAVLPRNVQTDEETSLAWTLKDQTIKRGRMYYAKLARGRATFVALRMIPHFNAIWGIRKAHEPHFLSRDALAMLKVLRREWEMGTSDLMKAARMPTRVACTRALDELQAAMIVVPADVVYRPRFTYIWTLATARFPDALRVRVDRDVALREIARCFLAGAGVTFRGELTRVTGLSRADAGRGNQALVAEGYATMLAAGVYRLHDPRG
jgi:hypothetical protein